jgi:cbb3-type cytochrome oxidase subunit 3
MSLADLRPSSPGQLALIGATAWLIGSFVQVVALLVPIGLALLLVAAMGWLLRPRTRTMYWRGRAIELPDDSPALGRRLYRTLFRR